jgi:VWFA-related protein
MRQLQWTVLLIVAAFAIAAAQQPTFRAGVTLVSTDVIARDEAGRFVPDLTKDNFTLLEDDEAQTISSFAMVRGGRTYNLLLPAPRESAPEGIVLPPSKPRSDDTAGRVLLIFIDDLHFEPELTPMVRRIMQQIGDSLIHEGDLVAVVSSGPSYLSIGPTYDKKTVMEAVGKIRGSGLIPAEIFKMLETSQGPADVRQRAQMAFYTAYSILGELEQVNNKRKAVIYVSTGYDFDPFRRGPCRNGSRAGWTFLRPAAIPQRKAGREPVLRVQPSDGRYRTAQVDARAHALSESRERVALYDRSARPLRRRRSRVVH